MQRSLRISACSQRFHWNLSTEFRLVHSHNTTSPGGSHSAARLPMPHLALQAAARRGLGGAIGITDIILFPNYDTETDFNKVSPPVGPSTNFPLNSSSSTRKTGNFGLQNFVYQGPITRPSSGGMISSIRS